MKTQISLVLLGLGLASGSAFAAHMDETPMPVSNDINVTAPDQSGMWSFGATAVLMQPTNKDFTYANTFLATSDGSDTDYHEVDPSYHWWFGADVTYAFPGNGRDVTLAYEGLHGDDEEHTNVAESGALFSNFSDDDYLSAEGETDTSYDAGDLVFGQKLDVGERIRLHPFMGVRYAHIDVEDTGKYDGGTATLDDVTYNTSEEGELDNQFNGVGPRFGSDAQINLGQGFSIRGRLGLSVLIGSTDTDYSDDHAYYSQTTGELVSTSSDDNDRDSNTHVVPEIDGRLGLNYTYTFDSNMALGFEAGWQATNYFNVVSDQSELDYVGHHYEDNGNFALQGPYARVQLDIA